MLTTLIALFAPPLIALGWYDRLRGGRLRPRQLVYAYAIFVVGINGLLYTIALHWLQNEAVVFTDRYFIKYSLAAIALAFIFPPTLNLLRSSISVRVLRNE